MKRRKIIISAILTVLFLGIGAFVMNYMGAQKEEPPKRPKAKQSLPVISVNQYAPSAILNNIPVDGRLSSYETVDLSSRVTGQIVQSGKPFKEGTYFKKGDLIFQIDSRELKYTVQAQRSALMTSISNMMPDLKFDLPEAHDRWAHYLSNFNVENRLASLPALNSEKEKYYVANQNILNQYYTIKSLESKLDDHNIYSPINGVITEANVYQGSIVQPGQKLGQIMNTYNYELLHL